MDPGTCLAWPHVLDLNATILNHTCLQAGAAENPVRQAACCTQRRDRHVVDSSVEHTKRRYLLAKFDGILHCQVSF